MTYTYDIEVDGTLHLSGDYRLVAAPPDDDGVIRVYSYESTGGWPRHIWTGEHETILCLRPGEKFLADDIFAAIVQFFTDIVAVVVDGDDPCYVEQKLRDYLWSCEPVWEADDWLELDRAGDDASTYWIKLCKEADVDPLSDDSVDTVEQKLYNGDRVTGLNSYLSYLFDSYLDSVCSIVEVEG